MIQRPRQNLRLLAEAGGTEEQVRRLLTQALDDGFLTSCLSAPMTVPDPAAHIVRVLDPHRHALAPETCAVLERIEEAERLLAAHNQARGAAADKLRDAADNLMHNTSAASREHIALDMRLDAHVRVPRAVLIEAEHAAHALVRLTRARGESPTWAAYATQFWERYGAGVLVPVREAVNLAAGLGFPADYPMSLLEELPPGLLPRDVELACRAVRAAVSGAREIVLTETDLHNLADPEAGSVAPHVEMGIRIRAASTEALDRGDFLIDVRPAWTAGVLSGRFAASLGEALSEVYRRLPTMVHGALPAQLSFAPDFPRAENVARIPAVLPHIISVGEHRKPAEHVIPVDDLAVFSTGRSLHLVSLSRRRVVEPVVLHPLALEKQAPPLARFVAMLARGSARAWTAFDWGAAAAALPYLPRVRYRRAILAPARWKLPAVALPAGPFTAQWHTALTGWAALWRCPARRDLRDDDRTMSLDLAEPLHARLIHQYLQHHDEAVLTEAVADDDLGWIGHAHEITVPLATDGPQIPHPDLTHAPLLTNQDLPRPGGPGRWLQAKVFTHPTAMDQIITRRLPALLDELGTSEAWFVRYRSQHETDHLRIRVRAGGNALETIAAWTERLTADQLASRLVIDGYRPEIGRYGTGPALEAAEAVFVADSLLTCFTLSDLPKVERGVLCALSMIDMAEGFLGTRDGRAWMATVQPHGEGRPDVTRPTVHQVLDYPLLTASQRMATALAQRRAALGQYRAHVDSQRAGQVLESLLHMHHNRMAGPDRASEAAARHAARQACRSLTARGKA
ncbi:lantibiotic dehydratase [Streptomyces sp. NPDC006975]|uniref:lantibiotic dehydratase n=1 Tax=Streptomyces sp. NPDC006975 TaxID=3154310 RepID=UPI0034550A77